MIGSRSADQFVPYLVFVEDPPGILLIPPSPVFPTGRMVNITICVKRAAPNALQEVFSFRIVAIRRDGFQVAPGVAGGPRKGCPPFYRFMVDDELPVVLAEPGDGIDNLARYVSLQVELDQTRFYLLIGDSSVLQHTKGQLAPFPGFDETDGEGVVGHMKYYQLLKIISSKPGILQNQLYSV